MRNIVWYPDQVTWLNKMSVLPFRGRIRAEHDSLPNNVPLKSTDLFSACSKSSKSPDIWNILKIMLFICVLFTRKLTWSCRQIHLSVVSWISHYSHLLSRLIELASSLPILTIFLIPLCSKIHRKSTWRQYGSYGFCSIWPLTHWKFLLT